MFKNVHSLCLAGLLIQTGSGIAEFTKSLSPDVEDLVRGSVSRLEEVKNEVLKRSLTPRTVQTLTRSKLRSTTISNNLQLTQDVDLIEEEEDGFVKNHVGFKKSSGEGTAAAAGPGSDHRLLVGRLLVVGLFKGLVVLLLAAPTLVAHALCTRLVLLGWIGAGESVRAHPNSAVYILAGLQALQAGDSLLFEPMINWTSPLSIGLFPLRPLLLALLPVYISANNIHVEMSLLVAVISLSLIGHLLYRHSLLTKAKYLADSHTHRHTSALLGDNMVVSSEKYETKVSVRSIFEKRMLLTVRGFRREDVGTYRSVAKNSLGQVERNIRLYEIPGATVRRPTPASSHPDDEDAEETGSAEAAESEPPPDRQEHSLEPPSSSAAGPGTVPAFSPPLCALALLIFSY